MNVISPRRSASLVAILLSFILQALDFFQPASAEDSSGLPSTCYLFAYFLSPGTDGLHLAWSRDGLKWSALNGGKSYLYPTVGDKIMRDPFLFFGPDGVFRLVWNDSGRHLRIGYASSRNLVTWSPQEEPQVMTVAPNCMNCWAPVINYDEANQCYQIVWASTIPGVFQSTEGRANNNFNHRFYVTTTRDFENFTATKLFYDPGFPCIDAFILPANNRFYLIFKNETDNPFPQKNLWMATGYDVAGPYGTLTGAIKTNPPSPVESPTVIKIGTNYILYYDCYTQGHYGAVRSTDMRHWQDISPELSMPQGIRHGSILAVPSSVVANLLHAR
jgi:hypothetical protein